MKIVLFGLALSSSWGNGHATTYRSLLRALAARGHELVFYEKDVPWYADHRDLPDPVFCDLRLYDDPADIDWSAHRDADAFVIGSFVEDTQKLVEAIRQRSPSVLAFYDIDTPVTIAGLQKESCTYLSRSTVPAFDTYLSFSGGPILERLTSEFGARNVKLLGCSVDTHHYHPIERPRDFALGYLGTYDESRQPMLEKLLLEPAQALPHKRFVVAGPQYPATIDWPDNVERIDHVPPSAHAEFYSRLECAINVTRADMVEAGFSPSVRVFEAAACARPVITDRWPGLQAFFSPEDELIVGESADDVLKALSMPADRREAIGLAGRRRVEQSHSADVRAAEFETMLDETIGAKRSREGVAA